MKKTFLSIVAFVLIILQPAACAPASTSTAVTASPSSHDAISASTPQSALTSVPCHYVDECPETVMIYDLIPGEYEPGVETVVEVAYDQPVFFDTGWIAKDYTILAQNVENMHFFFKVDGRDYWDDAFLWAPEPYYDQNDPGSEYAYQGAGVAVSGWKAGEPHQIRIGFTITEDINDGMESYPAGEVIEDVFTMNPVLSAAKISTATPESFANLMPQVERTASEDLIDEINPSTFVGNGYFSISPDHQRVAYAAYADGGQTCVIVDGKEQKKYDGIGTNSLRFSPDSKHLAYMAGLDSKMLTVLDGKEGPLYDGIGEGTLVFSPDSSRLAYTAVQDNQQMMVVDGIEGKPYSSIGAGSFVFSPDSRRTAYAVQKDGKPLIVVDGVEGKSYDTYGTYSLTFSPDSQRVAYVVGIGNKQLLVVDGKESPLYDLIGTLAFSAEGQHLAYVAGSGNTQFAVLDGVEGKHYEKIQGDTPLTFSPDGQHLAYVAINGDKFYVVVDGVEQQEYAGIVQGTLVFSPDSQHLSYKVSVGSFWSVIVDEVENRPYDGISEGGILFSPDSQHYAYIAEIDGQWVVVTDGMEGKPYDGIVEGSLVFSPDSQHLVYVAGVGIKRFIVWDRKEGKTYDGTTTPFFSPDGEHVAYAALTGSSWCLVVDGSDGKAYDGILNVDEKAVNLFDTSESLHYLGTAGYKIFLVQEKIK